MPSPSAIPDDLKTTPLATPCEPHSFAPLDDAQERVVYQHWVIDLRNAPRDMCMCCSIPEITERIHPGSYNRAAAQQCAFHLILGAIFASEFIVGDYCLSLEGNISDAAMILAMAGVLVVWLAVVTFWMWLLAKLSTSVRDYFHIDGSQGDDFWVMCCCTYRAVTQMKRQISTIDELAGKLVDGAASLQHIKRNNRD